MSRYELAGRTVVITGAAGGLGAELARELRRRGANLALLDLDLESVHKQAAELGPEAVAKGWVADVRNLDSLTTAIDDAAEHFGRIDVVVAAAGISAIAPLENLDPEVFERIVDIDLNGVWRTFRAALPHVVKQRGHLLAVSSMAAFVHSPLNGPYVASKAGVWALCNSLRLELRHHGVTVGSFHPTFFHTRMMDDVFADAAATSLWGGNNKGFWKMVPIEEVVAGAVSGIERRAQQVVVPKQNTVVAYAPGLFRLIFDRIAFRGNTIVDSIAHASPTGWNATR